MFDEFNYKKYWENIYSRGGISGAGSYGEIANYKAKIINGFLEKNHIQTIIEFGCGDGNQLSLMDYANYVGFDISKAAINICKQRFNDDPSKTFYDYEPKDFEAKVHSAQVVVCIDVLYHIIDEYDFKKTLRDIFECADYFVIIHTKLTREENRIIPSIKDRDIFKYLDEIKEFRIKNIYEKNNGTSANFIILERNLL